MTSLRLTNDEYAAALLLAGAVELALSLLATGSDTPFSGDDVMPRLAAGTAALTGRGLVVDGPNLSPDVTPIIETVARPAFTLYLRKTALGVDDGLAIHFRDDAIVVQHIDLEHAHTLTSVEGLDAATEHAAAFYGIDAASAATEVFTLPGVAAQPLLEASDAAARAAALDAAGISTTQAAFAADYASAIWRGSFLRVDYSHGHPTTRPGAAVIAGAERVWLLRAAPAGSVQIMHATFLSLHQELYSLSRL